MVSEDKERSDKTTILSLLWVAMLFAYMIRYALGVVAPTLMRLYHISPKTMGYVLSGWNWSYTPGELILGPIVDRFGPWIVMGLGSTAWALSTIALPLASTAVSLFLLRAIFGFSHSMLISTTSAAIARRFGSLERTRVIAVIFSGNQVGLAICATVASFILVRLGWRAVFYCMGCTSLVFSAAWFFAYPDKRIGKPLAPPSDLAGSHPQRVSWLSLFRYRSTWGIAFGQMGYMYVYFFFVSWLPGYLVLDRKMTLLNSGFVASLTFCLGMIGTLGGGWLGDYLIQRGVKRTVSRKSIIGFGLTLTTVMVIGIAFVNQNWLVVTLLSLSVGVIRLTTGSVNSVAIDLAPLSLVGSLAGIQNCFGSVGATLAPIITGYIVNSTGSFAKSFAVAGGMALFGAASFVLIMGNLEVGLIPPHDLLSAGRISQSTVR